MLVAIFGEKDSHAVYFLNQRGVTRLDVVNYISHGISKVPKDKTTRPRQATARPKGRAPQAPRARKLHGQPQRAGQGGQDRSDDRPRAELERDHAGAVPPPQEQPAAGR